MGHGIEYPPAAYPIFWLTGNSGAGKSTLAEGLRHAFIGREIGEKIVILDGDDMRASISKDAGFTKHDRIAHNQRVMYLANELQRQGFLVVVAVIAPFKALRDEIDQECSPVWVYVKKTQEASTERPYEPPESPSCTINNDELTIAEAKMKFFNFVEETLDRND